LEDWGEGGGGKDFFGRAIVAFFSQGGKTKKRGKGGGKKTKEGKGGVVILREKTNTKE